MTRNHLGIYALAVCFVSAIVFSVVLGKGIYGIIGVSVPQITLSSWNYKHFQNNDNFVHDWPEKKAIPDDADLTRLRTEGYQIALQTEQHSSWQGIINAVITILVSGVSFYGHWFIAKREQNKPSAE